MTRLITVNSPVAQLQSVQIQPSAVDLTLLGHSVWHMARLEQSNLECQVYHLAEQSEEKRQNCQRFIKCSKIFFLRCSNHHYLTTRNLRIEEQTSLDTKTFHYSYFTTQYSLSMCCAIDRQFATVIKKNLTSFLSVLSLNSYQ